MSLIISLHKTKNKINLLFPAVGGNIFSTLNKYLSFQLKETNPNHYTKDI